MAHQVAQLPGVAGRTPVSSYPWDRWLDGNAWHLSAGEDYTVATTALRAYIYRQAAARGINVKTVRDVDDTGITIRATTGPRRHIPRPARTTTTPERTTP
jgi:surface antigen